MSTEENNPHVKKLSAKEAGDRYFQLIEESNVFSTLLHLTLLIEIFKDPENLNRTKKIGLDDGEGPMVRYNRAVVLEGVIKIVSPDYENIIIKFVKDIKNKENLKKFQKELSSMWAATFERDSVDPSESRLKLDDFLTKWSKGFEGILDHIDSKIEKDLRAGKLTLSVEPIWDKGKEEFFLTIPGPGFEKAVGNPKGRKEAEFVVSEEHPGDVGGDYTIYKKKLLDMGINSFDAFYKALIDCFGHEWLPKVLVTRGMDYMFRNEHEKAFKAYVKNKKEDCPVPDEDGEIETSDEEEDSSVTSKHNLFIDTPQHPSIEINEAADSLTYGAHDPLDKIKSPIKLGLTDTIKDIFGYDGGWQEYKKRNYEDLTKKTIILRKDGTKVVADRPQDIESKKGDRIFQSATLWPFHVYFAFKEWKENETKQNSYKLVFVQTNPNIEGYLRSIPRRVRAAIINAGMKRAPEGTTLDQLLKMKLERSPNTFGEELEIYEKTWAGFSSFLKNQTLVTKDHKYYEILSRRIGMYGLDRNWYDKSKEGSVGTSVLIHALMNPPEGIKSGKTMLYVRDIGLKSLGKSALQGPEPSIFSADGKHRLYVDYRSPADVDEQGERQPRMPAFFENDTAPWERAKLWKSRSKDVTVPVLGFPVKVEELIQHHEWLATAGVRWPDDRELGIVLLIPENEESFADSEKLLFKRLGINENHSLRFDIDKNKYNTPDGTAKDTNLGAKNRRLSWIIKYDVDAGEDRWLPVWDPERDGRTDSTSGAEEDDVTDLGGEQIVSTQVSMKDLPEEIKNAMKDPNVELEELLQRRLDFCKRPERKENPTFLCTMGEEGNKMWREIAYLTKDAQKKPSKQKLEIIRNKRKEFLDAVNKEALGTPEGESADDYGSVKEYENPNESDEKRQERYKRLRELEDKISGLDTEGRRAPAPTDREREIYGNLREKIKDERKVREKINDHVLVLLNRFGGGVIEEQNPKSWKTLGVLWEWTGVGVNQSVSSAQAKAAKFASAGLVDNLFRGWNQKKHKDLEKGGQRYYNKRITKNDLISFYRYNTKKWKLKELPYGTLEKYIEDFKNKIIPVPYGSHWSAITIQYMMRADPDFAEHSRKGGKRGQYKNAEWGRRGNVMGHASYIGWGKREAFLLRRNKRKILKGAMTLDPRTYITLSIEKIKEIGYEPQIGDIIVDTGGHGDVVTTRGRVGGNLSRSIRSRANRRRTGPIRGMYQKSRYIVTKSMIAKRLYLGLPAGDQEDVASAMQEARFSSIDFLNESLGKIIQEINEGIY